MRYNAQTHDAPNVSVNYFVRSNEPYTTTIPTKHRITTLMHDPQYRVAIAWQNTAYNQPPHPSFYLDEAAPLPKRPNIATVAAKK